MQRPSLCLFVLGLILTVGTLPAEAQKSGRNRNRERFTVAAGEETVILIEQSTGRSWMLEHSSGEAGSPVWLPIERIDDAGEAQDWRHEQRAIAEEREHRERAERDEMIQRREAQRREEHSHQLQRNLDELQEVLRERKTQFGDQHPEVRELNEQIERVQREINELRAQSRRSDLKERSERGAREDRPVESGAGSAAKRKAHEQAREMQRSALEKHLKNLRENLGEDHPALKALELRIDQLQQESDDSGQTFKSNDNTSRDFSDADIFFLSRMQTLNHPDDADHQERDKLLLEYIQQRMNESR